MRPTIFKATENKRFERLVLYAISLFVRALYKTLRVGRDIETKQILLNPDSCALFAWHGTISMLPFVNDYCRNGAQMTGLMSPSKDGDYLARFFGHFGVESERGSSSRGGARSAMKLIKILRSGGSICITPDGPRGPKCKAKEGMISICEKSPETRMILLKIDFENSWKFKSWDGFNVPKPFSGVRIKAFEYANIAALKDFAYSQNMTPVEYCESMMGT